MQREAAKGGLIGSVIALREEEDDEADEDGVEFGVGDGNGEDEDADELKLFQMQHERVELLIRTILGSMEERIRLVYAGEFAAGACMKIWLQQPDVLLRWVRDDWIRRRGVLEEISKRGRGGE